MPSKKHILDRLGKLKSDLNQLEKEVHQKYEKDFCLGDYIMIIPERLEGHILHSSFKAISVEKVKEFIKNLKEEISRSNGDVYTWVENIIDKRVGDELK